MQIVQEGQLKCRWEQSIVTELWNFQNFLSGRGEGREEEGGDN